MRAPRILKGDNIVLKQQIVRVFVIITVLAVCSGIKQTEKENLRAAVDQTTRVNNTARKVKQTASLYFKKYISSPLITTITLYNV